MHFNLLAFDLDDTLIDTGSVSIPNAVEMINAEFGVPVTVEDWYKHGGYMGKAGQPLLDAIADDYGVTMPLERFLELRKAYLHKQLERGLHPAPGVVDVLAELHRRGRLVCVCTNSVAERAAITLSRAMTNDAIHLPDVFKERVYSALPATDAMQPKPAPHVYQWAAKVLAVDPARALTVEDTPTGIQAAVAAGYTAVGYVGLARDHDRQEASLRAAGAHHIIRHWDEYLPLLERLES